MTPRLPENQRPGCCGTWGCNGCAWEGVESHHCGRAVWEGTSQHVSSGSTSCEEEAATLDKAGREQN